MKKNEDMFGVVLFETTHDAIIGERLIRTLLPVALMPMPTRFSSGCGIALRFEYEDKARMEILLKEHQIPGHIEFVEGESHE